MRAETGSDSGGDLHSRLERLREVGFIGRREELELFQDLLVPETASRVLLIHGAGGVGKTTLLSAYGRQAREAGWPVAEISAHELDPDPGELERGLRHRLGGMLEDGGILLLDDFEALAARERWLRDRFLVRMPDTIRVVIAGRWTPEELWRTDPGWQGLARIHELGDFSPEETRWLLDRYLAGGRRAAEVHDFTHGHPLAVSLVAELLSQQPDASLTWDRQIELVHGLVAWHLGTIHSPHHRALLHAATLPPYFNTAYLEAMVPSSDPEADLGWLEGLSFTRKNLRGIQIHELVSEALRVEFGRLAPDRHARLIRAAAAELGRRMESENSEGPVREFAYLLRHFPKIRETLPTDQVTRLYMEGHRAADLPVLSELVGDLDGPESRRWFELWVERQPGGLAVLREPDGSPAGMSFFIDPFREEDPVVWDDPAAAAFRDYLAEWAPLRPGEQAHLCRFTLTTRARVGSTAAFTQLRSHNAAHGLRTPGLAFAGAVLPGHPDVEDLAAVTHFPHWEVNYPPLEGTSFQLDGKSYFLMGHDWRLEPPSVWAVNTAERALTGQDPVGGRSARAGLELSRSAFREAVRDALKGLGSRSGLEGNPLLESALIGQARAELGPGCPDELLAALLHQTVEELETDPEQTRYGQVLRATYLRGAPKQRAAAEMVGLTFSTYRRRLEEAIERLTDRLWQKERLQAGSPCVSEGPPPESA